jgi:2-dehydro-3-deoxyglucarate aldolase/4-hydroxy-2-oxoheptanedioate aldolase
MVAFAEGGVMWIDKLRSGKRIIGTMLRMVRHSAAARIAKNSGLDFIMLDMEHGEYSLESVSDVFRVARALDLGSFVRIPELAKGYVSRAMEAGANGVMVPKLESVEEAEALVRWAKFAPLGDRGLGSTGGHTDFSIIAGKIPEFMEKANRETVSIAQIETKGAVECIDEIG